MKPQTISCSISASRVALLLLLLPAAPASAMAGGRTIEVTTSIQAAVDAAQPGDRIHVPEGTYKQNVLVSKDDITIEGDASAVLDGTGTLLSVGIMVSPTTQGATLHGFALRGLRVQNFRGTGVLLHHVSGFDVSGGDYRNNLIYGVFSLLSEKGAITHNRASGSNDTCLYVGESHDIAVLDSDVNDCTIGIEVENSMNAIVGRNTLRDNSLGIIVDNVPGAQTVNSTGVLVAANNSTANNRPNPLKDPADLASNLPSGVGILNAGSDRVAIIGNRVDNNNTAGVAVVRIPPAFAALDPRLDPLPDETLVALNLARNNGQSPDPRSLIPLPGVDLLWDGSGSQNCWERNTFGTSFPNSLPTCP